MKKALYEISKMLTCLIILMFFLSSLPLGLGQIVYGRLYVSPREVLLYSPPTQIGSTFNITIKIANYSHVAGWQVKLVYDKSLLSTSSANISYASNFIFPSGSYIAMPASVDHFNATHDYILMSASTYDLVEYNGSDAGLVSVKFSILEIPEIGGVFSCMLWLDRADTWIVNNAGQILHDVLVDGYFSIMTLAPGGGTIYVSPAQSEFTAPPKQVGDTFNVTVRIANYTHVAAWQVKLVYDGRLLNASNTVYASDFIFPKDSYVTIMYSVGVYNATHNYTMIMSATYGAIEYNGTNAGLATVTFSILKVPGANESFSCILWLEPIDTWTVNTDIYETVETLIDGHYSIAWTSQPPSPPPSSEPWLPFWAWGVIIFFIALIVVGVVFYWKRRS